MQHSADSLRVAFGLDDESMREIRAKVAASRAAVELARGALRGSAPALLEGALGTVHERVDEILSTPLSTILAEAWRAYAPFLKYCDPAKYPPGDTAEVEIQLSEKGETNRKVVRLKQVRHRWFLQCLQLMKDPLNLCESVTN